jgi:polysaccharide biosynthesis/export protein
VYDEREMSRGCLRFFRFWIVFVFGVLGCSSTGPYIWVDSLPAQPGGAGGDVVIADGDNLNVKVFNQEPLSAVQRVRSDGKIALPVIGEVVARGKRPAVLAAEIQDRLKAVVVAPSVTVTLDAGGEMKVSVIGEVKNAGVFPLEHGANVLHAIAAAGGLSEYADGDKVFVVRKSLPQRVRFRFSDLRSGDQRSIAFLLQSGDIVVVE